MTATFACSSACTAVLGVNDVFYEPPGAVDAGPDPRETRVEAAADGAPAAADAGSDASVFRLGDGGAGDFATEGSGPFTWLVDEQGRPFVRIAGGGTFVRTVPVQAKRARLAFRVRVPSGPDGGNPYINVAALTVGARADAADLVFEPRVLVQRQNVELGCEERPGGPYRATSRTATSTTWTSYALVYVPRTGRVTLVNADFADAELPFPLPTDVTSIQIRAGAMGSDHVVDVADLELAVE